MGIIALPLLVAIVGLLVFALCTGDSKEIGRILFFCGAFWLVGGAAPQMVHLLR